MKLEIFFGADTGAALRKGRTRSGMLVGPVMGASIRHAA